MVFVIIFYYYIAIAYCLKYRSLPHSFTFSRRRALDAMGIRPCPQPRGGGVSIQCVAGGAGLTGMDGSND